MRAKKQKTTLIDIAEHLDISVSTVSRALNNARDVSEQTRKKVLKAANELDYTPNETARNLVTQTNNTIAALVPDISNPYYPEIITSIETRLVQEGFTLLLCITNENDVHTDYYLNEILKKRVDGIILLSTYVKNKALLQKMQDLSVVVGIQSYHSDIDSITVTGYEDTRKMIEHLIDLGHKKIGFLGYKLYEEPKHGGKTRRFLSERLQGYKDALAGAGIPFDKNLIANDEPVGDPGYFGAKKLLQNPSITAIHCMNEYTAMGAYIAIKDAGISIPKDLSFSAYDGLSISRLIRPQLATVEVPVQAMGVAAAELVLQRLQFGKKKEKQNIVFESKLRMGKSIGIPPPKIKLDI